MTRKQWRAEERQEISQDEFREIVRLQEREGAGLTTTKNEREVCLPKRKGRGI